MSKLQIRCVNLLLWSTGVFLAIQAILLYGTDLFISYYLFTDYAKHALMWYIPAIAPAAFSYILMNNSWVSPFPALNMFSAWCLVNMFIPLFSYLFVDNHYSLVDTEGLGSAYKLSLFVALFFYFCFRYDLLNTDTTCHCDNKY